MISTPPSAQFDPYAVLGVSPDDTAEHIAHAYRALVREHHPDTRPQDSHETDHDATLRNILLAHAILTDAHRHQAHPQTPIPRNTRPTANHQDPPVLIGTFNRIYPSIPTTWLIT